MFFKLLKYACVAGLSDFIPCLGLVKTIVLCNATDNFCDIFQSALCSDAQRHHHLHHQQQRQPHEDFFVDPRSRVVARRPRDLLSRGTAPLPRTRAQSVVGAVAEHRWRRYSVDTVTDRCSEVRILFFVINFRAVYSRTSAVLCVFESLCTHQMLSTSIGTDYFTISL